VIFDGAGQVDVMVPGATEVSEPQTLSADWLILDLYYQMQFNEAFATFPKQLLFRAIDGLSPDHSLIDCGPNRIYARQILARRITFVDLQLRAGGK
jgi:hypothetical protein